MRDGIVVIAEHADGKVKPVTYELIGFARKLQQLTPRGIRVLILGADILRLAEAIAERGGLDVTAFEVPELPAYKGFSGAVKLPGPLP